MKRLLGIFLAVLFFACTAGCTTIQPDEAFSESSTENQSDFLARSESEPAVPSEEQELETDLASESQAAVLQDKPSSSSATEASESNASDSAAQTVPPAQHPNGGSFERESKPTQENSISESAPSESAQRAAAEIDNLPESNSESRIEKQIYYTRTGTKYHYKNPCGNGTYYPCTLDEALAKGLEPCSKCVK